MPRRRFLRCFRHYGGLALLVATRDSSIGSLISTEQIRQVFHRTQRLGGLGRAFFRQTWKHGCGRGDLKIVSENPPGFHFEVKTWRNQLTTVRRASFGTVKSLYGRRSPPTARLPSSPTGLRPGGPRSLEIDLQGAVEGELKGLVWFLTRRVRTPGASSAR